MAQYVTLKKEKDIAILTIHRPEALNALNRELVDQLDVCFEQVNADSNLRVLLLFGEDNFAAGADIKAMISCSKEEAERFCFSDTFQKLYQLKIPTIAAIEGYALGGGLELAITCDLRVVSQKAKLGFPEIGLGIMPGAGGTVIAPKLLGEAKAMEMIMLGTIIGGEEAYRIGLINKVVEPGQAYAEAYRWAEKIAESAPIAMKAVKETIRRTMEKVNYEEAIAIERTNWSNLFLTEDQEEGMQAFVEKRKPCYTGK